MIFTDHKNPTLRRAKAIGMITASPETVDRVRNKTTPKGDVLEVARTAGILAAKKTWEIIPYCHPIPLDGIAVDFSIEGNTIQVAASVATIWKTGVEMEALTAAGTALLTVYDMLKPIDASMEISALKLHEKKGGKSDFQNVLPPDLKVAVLVTSDGTFEGKREDRSGKAILQKLSAIGMETVDYAVLPDDQERIRNKLLRYCEEGFRLVITTGGTGLGPKDVTVEATREVIEREAPGITEAMRSYGQCRTPYAMLSRGVAGVRGKTVLINLPGSTKGAEESMDAVFPAVLHAFPMMDGGTH